MQPCEASRAKAWIIGIARPDPRDPRDPLVSAAAVRDQWNRSTVGPSACLRVRLRLRPAPKVGNADPGIQLLGIEPQFNHRRQPACDCTLPRGGERFRSIDALGMRTVA